MTNVPVKISGGVSFGSSPLILGGQIVPNFPLEQPAEFDPTAFDHLVAQHGYDVLWEKAAYCPNRPRGSIAPLEHHISCSVCNGERFVFFGGCDTRMLIQAVTLNQQYQAQGRWDLGMIRVTTRPNMALNYWDRLTLRNGTARFLQVLNRVAGEDALALKYEPLSIDYVAWLDRSGALVQGVVDEDVGIQDGLFTWLSAGPDSGTSVTVSYTYRPRYVIQDLLHQHRESPVGGTPLPFPTQAVARLDFLVRDQSKDPQQQVDADPFNFRVQGT